MIALPEETRPLEDTLVVRPAGSEDVPGILGLVNEHARRGNLLPRTPQSVYQGIHNWIVAVQAGRVLGCVSLLRYTSGLVEVRSLAVHDDAQGRGIGTLLVQELIAEARRREIPRLFALTRAVSFFGRCGFTVTDISIFPEKVWHDCRICPVRNRCDETAMILKLSDNL